MTIMDISLPFSETTLPIYEGDPPFFICRKHQIDPDDADTFSMSALFFTTHTGTHIDAPCHIVPDAPTVDQLSLEVLCGPATVVDLRGQGLVIDEPCLRSRAGELEGVKRLLLKTDNAQILGLPFQRQYSHLTPDAARFLRQQIGIELYGIDYLSVDPWPDPFPGFGFPVHRELLEGHDPVVIVEGLDLREVESGEYELLCLPLRLDGADGAPARAVLRR